MWAADFVTSKGKDKQEAARERLEVIAKGFIRGLLPAAPIGRPRTIKHHTLLKDLKKLLARLNDFLNKDSFFLMRKRDESQSEFAHRISDVIHRLYHSAYLSLQLTSPADQPLFDDNGHPQWKKVSLDPAQARVIAEHVVGRRGKASSYALILGILEHHHRVPPRALESHLARAKEQDPDLIESLRIDFPRFARHL